MERLKSKYFVAFLIGYLICMLVSLPSFVYADVTIDTTVTSTQFLGTPAGTATVTNTGMVFTVQQEAIFVSVDGWSINVSGLVAQFGPANNWGIRFAPEGGNPNPVSGTVNNWGSITGTGWGIAMGSGSISNYGTITGSGGTAISLAGTGNRVTLGTGSVINGNTVAAYGADSANSFFLDGQGTIAANQIQNFNTLNKTGSGTWKLTGDMDYTNVDIRLMPITVEAGILTVGARSAVGTGVKTNTFVQNAGASLGFAVQSPGLTVGPVTTTLTGELRVNTANFNNGTIVVIPTVGTYPTTTTYLNVLTVGTAFDVNNTKWSQVTSNSAFNII